MSHSPGPWSVVSLTDAHQRGVFEIESSSGTVGQVFDEADALRLCECVNALEGANDPKTLIAQLAQLCQEQAARSLLEEAVEGLSRPVPTREELAALDLALKASKGRGKECLESMLQAASQETLKALQASLEPWGKLPE